MDFEAYSLYCDEVLEPVLRNYSGKYAGVILNPNRKNLIWKNYQEFNVYCKTHYMKKSDHLLDRHKVVACYMYAIEKAHVVVAVPSIEEGDDSNLMLNERLAFCFGMTMLRALILDLVDDIADEELKDKAEKVFEGEFVFPKCNHGNYKNNFLSQLYFTYKDNSYNILSLANSLYLLEAFTLVKNGLHEDLFKLLIDEKN